MRSCFSELASQGFGLPSFVGKECGVFFDLSQKDNIINYRSRYDPNLNAVAQTAEYFGLDYTHNFHEINMGIMGEATRIKGEYGITRLIEQDISLGLFDAACDHFAYNGQFYDTIYDLMPVLLDEKKVKASSKAVKERIGGKLPHIDIAGNDFTIDWEARKLIETNVPDNYLEINRAVSDKNGAEPFYLFDRHTHKFVNVSYDAAKLTPQICIIDLPDMTQLDPVGLARQSGFYDTDFLLVYPYLEYQIAPVLEISEILNYKNTRQRDS